MLRDTHKISAWCTCVTSGGKRILDILVANNAFTKKLVWWHVIVLCCPYSVTIFVCKLNQQWNVLEVLADKYRRKTNAGQATRFQLSPNWHVNQKQLENIFCSRPHRDQWFCTTISTKYVMNLLESVVVLLYILTFRHCAWTYHIDTRNSRLRNYCPN